MPLFYISFATDEGFRGATVVKGDDAQDAMAEASFRGLNPGGEAAIFEVPPEAEDHPDMARMLNRLAGREEMMAHGGERHGDLSEELQDEFASRCDIVCEDCNK